MDALSSQFSGNFKSLTSEVLGNRQQNQLESFKNSLPEKSLEQIEETAKDFEAVFLTQMLKPMFQELEVEPPFGGGHSEKVFRGLLIDEFGKEFAKRGGIGLADMVKKEMIEMQARMMKQQEDGSLKAPIQAYNEAKDAVSTKADGTETPTEIKEGGYHETQQ